MNKFHDDNIFDRVRYSVNIGEVVRNLLPHGKKQGNEWVSLNPLRNDSTLGSFKVNLRTGKWADFALDHRGKGIISLYSYLNNVDAYRSALEVLGEYRYGNYVGCSGIKLNKTDYIDKIISECIDPRGTVVEKYLSNRDINCKLPLAIYYHPKLYHAETKECYPAMVCLVSKGNTMGTMELVGIHRTYLTCDAKKADIEPNKMMLGSVNGGGVHMQGSNSSHIIIAEGIETSLSLYQSTSKYTIACLSASNMPNLVLPPCSDIQSITIAVDNDEAGRRAGTNTAAKLLSLGYSNVRVVKSHIDDINDFNDLLRKE